MELDSVKPQSSYISIIKTKINLIESKIYIDIDKDKDTRIREDSRK
jgi:hypothetical protein